jgi:ribonuclease PH
MPRHDGREAAQMRPVRFERQFTRTAPGSVLASFGETRVLCTATYTDGVPSWLQGRGQGWLTAEYAMLPSSTNRRKPRDRAGRVDGRSVEIQRLIGRCLRGVMDFKRMTERTIWIDCDVMQADGGTRTAAISGAWVALHDLLMHMDRKRVLRSWPLRSSLGAVSVGVFEGEAICDLDYHEDSKAEVDLNLVMTGEGELIEVQGSAEGAPFSRALLDRMLDLGEAGIGQIFELQREALGLPKDAEDQ